MRIGVMVTTLLLAGLAACDKRPGNPRAAELPLRDSVDSVLRRPRVVQAAAVVVFWLPASDTLHPDEAATAYEELTLATERIVRPLAAYEIQLLPTHADTLYIELSNHR